MRLQLFHVKQLRLHLRAEVGLGPRRNPPRRGPPGAGTSACRASAPLLPATRVLYSDPDPERPKTAVQLALPHLSGYGQKAGALILRRAFWSMRVAPKRPIIVTPAWEEIQSCRLPSQ